MFWRLIWQSFQRQRRRKLLAGAAITLGVAVVTAMLSVSTDVGDRLGQALRAYGANIVVYPLEDTLDVQVAGATLKPASEGAYISEAELPKIKQIFWSHNIVGIAPMLPTTAALNHGEGVPVIGTYFSHPIKLEYETFHAGIAKTHPWWKIEGAWPDESKNEAIVGRLLAQRAGVKVGDTVNLGDRSVLVSGILDSGREEDNAVVAPITFVQQLIGRPGAVRRIYVSALTKPEDDFGRRDPKSMSGPVFERWMCSPYANSIALQITQVIPNARAEQIRAVAQNEGIVLDRISLLMWLIAAAALLAAALTVGSATATSLIERKGEVALLRSLGASKTTITTLFVTELTVLACVAGVLGYGIGMLIAQQLSVSVFGVAATVRPLLLPLLMLVALVIAGAGAMPAIRRAVRLQPAILLRGDAE